MTDEGNTAVLYRENPISAARGDAASSVKIFDFDTFPSEGKASGILPLSGTVPFPDYSRKKPRRDPAEASDSLRLLRVLFGRTGAKHPLHILRQGRKKRHALF